MGVFHFIKAIKNHNENLEDKSREIKPIIGCEFNVCEDSKDKSRRDDGFQIVFLAKNKRGYHNLSKMSSLAYTSGFYYVPRIDKKIVQKYKDDLNVEKKSNCNVPFNKYWNKALESIVQGWH